MTIKLLTDADLRAAAQAGALPADAHLRKAFTAEVKATADETSRVLDFTISTASVDRVGDSVAVDGWQLGAYKKNPVVLWAHDPSMLPVAKASKIRVDGGALKASAEFMARDISGFADAVFQCLKQGFLSAVSVGFIPIKYSFVDDPARRWGIDFEEQELLEFSVVPIPANAEALIEARSVGGIDTAPFREWAERMLDQAGSVLVPRDLLEETFRQAKTPGAVRRRYLAKASEAEWKVGAASDLPVDADTAWDGPAAAKRMLDDAGFDGETPDAAKAARGFLIHDAANPALRGSYKLPFADIVDGTLKAVDGGIRAAASRLPQTDAPDAVREEARKVLDGYETKLGEDKDLAAAVAVCKDLDEVLDALGCALKKGETPVDALSRALEEMAPPRSLSFVNGKFQIARASTLHVDLDLDTSALHERLDKIKAELNEVLDLMDEAGIAPTGQKAGRRISNANEALLKKALDHHESASKCIKDVLASNTTDDPADDPSDDQIEVIEAPAQPEDERAKRIREAKELIASTKR